MDDFLDDYRNKEKQQSEKDKNYSINNEYLYKNNTVGLTLDENTWLALTEHIRKNILQASNASEFIGHLDGEGTEKITESLKSLARNTVTHYSQLSNIYLPLESEVKKIFANIILSTKKEPIPEYLFHWRMGQKLMSGFKNNLNMEKLRKIVLQDLLEPTTMLVIAKICEKRTPGVKKIKILSIIWHNHEPLSQVKNDVQLRESLIKKPNLLDLWKNIDELFPK